MKKQVNNKYVPQEISPPNDAGSNNLFLTPKSTANPNYPVNAAISVITVSISNTSKQERYQYPERQTARNKQAVDQFQGA